MEDQAILIGMVIGGFGWWLLVHLMKIGGYRWWIRHGAGWLVGPLGLAGVMFALAALVGASDAETGERLGALGVVLGLIIASPLLIPLALLWRKSPRPIFRDAVKTGKKASPSKNVSPSPAPLPERTAKATATKKITQQKPRPAPEVYATGNLEFVYEDAEGNISTRELENWDDDGEYIKGYCLSAGDIRTFRRDRIIVFLAGEELLSPADDDDDYDYHAPLPRPDTPMDVLFTGFPAARRVELESAARDAGMIVRTKVTKNLAILVSGPKAGPSKINAALERGSLLITADQFLHMLETGEVPA